MPGKNLEEALERAKLKDKIRFFVMTAPGFSLNSSIEYVVQKFHLDMRNELRDFLGHQAQYFSKNMSDEVQSILRDFISHIFKEEEAKASENVVTIPLKK